jgi:DNA-binding NarL/FixJ family response regulator
MLALRSVPRIEVIGMVQDLASLRELLRMQEAQLALIDVSADLECEDMRLLAAERPEVKLLALGVVENRSEVIRCAYMGFRGYIPRDISLPELAPLLADAADGRARCSGEIAAGLMHALFRQDPQAFGSAGNPIFTAREKEIVRLLSRRLTNKEIARDLALSLGTVKNHVHNVLTKLQVPSRGDVARLAPDQR